MSTALTQLQCIDNSNQPLYDITILFIHFKTNIIIHITVTYVKVLNVMSCISSIVVLCYS